MLTLKIIASLIFLFIALVMLFGSLLSAPRYKGSRTDHFDGSRFFNPGGEKPRPTSEIMKWLLNRNQGKWEMRGLSVPATSLPSNSNELRISFVNHTTFLIQLPGINLLTDPVWSKRVSPFSWAGPKRYMPPGLRINDLPEIQLVLISHNHYDHLDISTIWELKEKFNPIFLVPLGVGKLLKNSGIAKFQELDWWQEYEFKDTTFVAVPAVHFSGRGLFDKNNTLWCGYLIKQPKGNIYFAGDTGYSTHFTDISQLGEIRLAILPIGPVRPRKIMAPVHLSPEEAIAVHKANKFQTSIAMHFGTFPLGDDGMDETPELLKDKLIKENISLDSFKIMKQGESCTF